MYQVWVIDEQGFFTGESYIVRYPQSNHVTTPVPSGLIKPRWRSGWIEGATEEEIQAWREQFLPPKDLTKEKTNLILASKEALAEWLYIHPVMSEVKGSPEYYAVTQDKQALLTQNILLHEMSKEAGIPYSPSWNSVGKECEAWTITELTQLSFEITAYVVPRVKLQQKYETIIMGLETEEDINSITYDYDKLVIGSVG